MELLRLSRGADADLAAEHARYRLRAEAAGIARREVEGRRKKLEMLRRRFGGVVKANASRAEHALRRAEQEKGEAQAKEREIERLKEAAEELAKFKEEREKLARGNERFLAFLEAVAEGQPEMPSFEAILGRFSSLSSDSDALAARLSDARAASQETAGALEALAAESLARQEGADAATLRREVAVVSFEAEKAQNEVDGILERDGARMEKSEAVRRCALSPPTRFR
ncbi:hypothetical protein DFJ74DRAFT_667605 [Hyaloraphidium curvatum]|nr:hypothetical protein DFJ74DRAFT_667605 [Hyaloraphidium curvatum]